MRWLWGWQSGWLFDAAWLEIVFVVAAGYATEHMCFALSRMGLYLLNLPYETSPEHLGHALVTRFGIFPLAALAIYFLAVKGNKKKTEFGNGDLRIAALAAILMLTAITISVYWSYDHSLDGTKNWRNGSARLTVSFAVPLFWFCFTGYFGKTT